MIPAITASLEHIGESKVDISADSLEELFAEVARFISASNGAKSSGRGEWIEIEVTARDTPTLLVDWANDLLGRSESDDRAYSEVRNVMIRQHPNQEMSVTAQVLGTPVDFWSSPLKGATYHDMRIDHRHDRWHAVMLFDV